MNLEKISEAKESLDWVLARLKERKGTPNECKVSGVDAFRLRRAQQALSELDVSIPKVADEDRPVEPFRSDEDPEAWAAIAEWERARADNFAVQLAEKEKWNKFYDLQAQRMMLQRDEANRQLAEERAKGARMQGLISKLYANRGEPDKLNCILVHEAHIAPTERKESDPPMPSHEQDARTVCQALISFARFFSVMMDGSRESEANTAIDALDRLLANPSIDARELAAWINVKDRFPEKYQSCLFISKSDEDFYNLRLLGGTYQGNEHGGPSFGTPGLILAAEWWMPYPPLPAEVQAALEEKGD